MVAVDGLDLTIDRGTITAVLGPNGAGKTTTLETCEGYRRPQEGTVSVLGLDPWAERKELLPRIGVMLQDGGAWGGVRAMEMLRHVAALHAHPLDPDTLGDRLGLPAAGGRRTGGCRAACSSGSASRWRWSGGPSWSSSTSPPRAWTRRRGARPGTCSRSCARPGVTVVLTTHYIEEAERLADQVHIIDRGRLVVSGTPERSPTAAAESRGRVPRATPGGRCR